MTTKTKNNLLTDLIEKIISTQVKKSEEPKTKTGVSGTSVYVEQSEVLEKIKKDRAVLEHNFNHN